MTVELGEEELALTITGWYRETEDSGEILQIREEDYAKTGRDHGASYAVTVSPGASAAAVAATLGDRLGPSAQAFAYEVDDSEVQPFRTALRIMATLLMLVALSHLFATALTNAREQSRQLGVLRTIGLSDPMLAGAALTQGAVLGIASLAVGLPLGVAAHGVLGDALTSEMGVGPGLTAGPRVIAVVALGLVVVALAGTTVAGAISRITRRPAADLVRTD